MPGMLTRLVRGGYMSQGEPVDSQKKKWITLTLGPHPTIHNTILGLFVSARPLAKQIRTNLLLVRPSWHSHRPYVPISGPWILIPGLRVLILGLPSTVGWPWLVTPMSRAKKNACRGWSVQSNAGLLVSARPLAKRARSNSPVTWYGPA